MAGEYEDIGYRWVSCPSVDVDAVKSEFREEAESYDRQLGDWDYRTPKDSLALMERYVAKSANILEAGCGTGLPGVLQYQAGYTKLCGCDLSDEMLAIARSKGVYSRLVQADLQQALPFDDDEFDAVTCLATLTYIEDPELTLREFCRVTRAGGIVLLSHRQDLFENRRCDALLDGLERAGLWEREHHSSWKLYIPGHPAYREQVRVGYFVYRVATKR